MLSGDMHFSRLDYVTSTIMRGRDHGLPNYNAVRKAMGLPEIRDLADINPKIKFNETSVSYMHVETMHCHVNVHDNMLVHENCDALYFLLLDYKSFLITIMFEIPLITSQFLV